MRFCSEPGGIAQAQTVKGEASFSASGGYARLLFKLAEDVPVEVTTAGSIVIIRFASPIDIPMDRWVEGALDYVSSARRDPDGSAIRLSLARRVRINTMAAGERTFIDFLPDSWTGAPPSLPIEVVRELAERARAAEKALRLQRAEAIAKKRPPIRVRALVQPTFVRFVFEMPDGVGASSVLNDGKLSLQFGGLLSFDLADAKIAAPPNIASINQKVEGDLTQVEIALIGDVDVHSFREEKNYIVDVGFQSDKPKESPLAEVSRGARRQARQGGWPLRGDQAADFGSHRQGDEGGSQARGRHARGQGRREVAAPSGSPQRKRRRRKPRSLPRWRSPSPPRQSRQRLKSTRTPRHLLRKNPRRRLRMHRSPQPRRRSRCPPRKRRRKWLQRLRRMRSLPTPRPSTSGATAKACA